LKKTPKRKKKQQKNLQKEKPKLDPQTWRERAEFL